MTYLEEWWITEKSDSRWSCDNALFKGTVATLLSPRSVQRLHSLIHLCSNKPIEFFFLCILPRPLLFLGHRLPLFSEFYDTAHHCCRERSQHTLVIWVGIANKRLALQIPTRQGCAALHCSKTCAPKPPTFAHRDTHGRPITAQMQRHSSPCALSRRRCKQHCVL